MRAVLEHKRLPYERLPALSNRHKVKAKGGIGKVPALEIDGAFYVDSTDIVHELDRRFPERPVLPPPGQRRAQVHLIEDWCDESLYFLGLYYHWRDPAGGVRAQLPLAIGDSSPGALAHDPRAVAASPRVTGRTGPRVTEPTTRLSARSRGRDRVRGHLALLAGLGTSG